MHRFLKILLLAGFCMHLNGGDSYYPPANRFDAWLHRVNPIPSITFREPLRYTFFEFNSSLAIYGFSGANPFKFSESAMGFDSTETTLNGFRNSFTHRNYFDMDLNLLRINWLTMMLPVNRFDYLTGFGVRRFMQILPVGLNGQWGTQGSGLSAANYRPQVTEFYMCQTLYYQPFEKLFIRLENSYALGNGTAYQTQGADRLLPMTGSSSRSSLSLQYALDNRTQTTNLVVSANVFLNSGYYTVNDSKDITPLEYINFHSLGFGISLYAQLGARRSQGDRALDKIRKRDYIAAREEMNSWVLKHPRSPRKALGLRYLSYCDSMIFYEYYKMANQALGEFRIEDALGLYNKAFGSGSESIRKKVVTRRESIGRIFVLNAMQELQTGDYQQAEAILSKAAEMSPFFSKECDRAMAFVNIYKARSLISSGLYDRAGVYLQLAEQQNPDLKTEVERYVDFLASVRVKSMEKEVLDKDFYSAKADLDAAMILDRDLADLLRNYDDLLNRKIAEANPNPDGPALYESYRTMVDEIQAEAKGQGTPLKATVGMTLVQIQDTFGEPAVRKQVTQGGLDYELWIYKFTNKTLELYFRNAILTHINEIPEKGNR